MILRCRTTYLIEYYKKFGFDVYGEEYLEDEILT